MAISESIFNGQSVIIPMADVAYIEKSSLGRQPNIVIVMRGAQHTYDNAGNYDGRYGRADCPGLSGEEAQAFLDAWLYYRHELDGPFISPETAQ